MSRANNFEGWDWMGAIISDVDMLKDREKWLCLDTKRASGKLFSDVVWKGPHKQGEHVSHKHSVGYRQ